MEGCTLSGHESSMVIKTQEPSPPETEINEGIRTGQTYQDTLATKPSILERKYFPGFLQSYGKTASFGTGGFISETASGSQVASPSLVAPFPNGFRPKYPRHSISVSRSTRFKNPPRLQKIYPGKGEPTSGQLSKEVQEQNVKRIASSQCLTSVMERVTQESRGKLEEYEFFPNWMNAKTGMQFFTEYELDGMLSFLRNEGNEMNMGYNVENKFEVFGLAPIICNNSQAFLKILKQDFAGADESLDENNRLIDICLNSNKEIEYKDYITGLFYIIKGLKIIIESQLKTLGKEFDLDEFICTQVENFSELPTKSKVAVWASKHFFLKLVQHKGPLVYKEMNEFVFLDPDYYEWRLYHYLAIREDRRKRHGSSSIPEDGEIQALQHAWNMAPMNPFCLVYMGLAAAECLRSRSFVSQDRPLTFGQLEFMSLEEAVYFIKQNCITVVLRTHPQCIRTNILIAHILSHLLPFKQRDVNLARECVFQAYRSGQEISSKANHRLALYMLESFKTPSSSPSMCEGYFEKAFNLDKRNVEALFNLLEVCLSQPKQSEPKIRMLFSVQLHNMDLSEESMARLNFLKGCFHMMIDEVNSAINYWVTAYNLRPSGLNFKILQTHSYVYRIYYWPRDKLNLHIAISETQKILGSLSTVNDNNYKKKTIVMEILELQQDALSTDAFYCSKMASAINHR